MTRTSQELMDMIKENNIQMIDFKIVDINGQYRLKWAESPRYIKILMSPLIEHKEEIFAALEKEGFRPREIGAKLY